MNSFPRWLRLALAALLPILATGCVEFEKQTVYLVFPKDRDEVHALVVYEGLRVDDSNAEGLKSAKEQLDLFTKEQAVCLWVWPLSVDLTPDPQEPPNQKKIKDLFRKHLTIKNGAFYTNADKKLCGYQHITIRDASKFVTAANNMFSEGVLAEDLTKWKPLDKESQELLRKAASDHHAWLKLTPGQLRLDLPMTMAASRNIKRGVLGVDQWAAVVKMFREDRPKPEDINRVFTQIEALPMISAMLADNPLSFDQRRDRILVSLGVGEGEPIHANVTSMPPREPTKIDAELADYAKTLSVKFRKDVTVDSLIDEFKKAHGDGKKKE